MVGFKHTLCALLLTMVTGMAIAQNNTNSPYTRYGYGDLSDQSFGNSKAMGGIAFGLRDGAQINPLNPASYTAIDSLTFLFEGGVSLQNMNISGSGVKLNAKNSSFDYLAMQFRLHPRIAMSVGLLPFSNVGYSVSDSKVDNGVSQTRSFTGDGGLHQLYGGIGVKVLKNLSLGVNASYFWGDITRTRTVIYPATSESNSYIQQMGVSISDYKLDFGAQYTLDLSKKHSMTIGAVFSPKHKLNNDYTITTQVSTTNSNNLDATFEVPNTFGIGFTYNYDKRLTVGLDYSLQQWSKTKFDVNTPDEAVREDFKETYTYCDRHKISVGAEYIPNLIGRSYLSHIKYRLGAYYTTPYYKVGGKEATREYGVTAGFGLPVPRSRSILSISGQFVRISGQEAAFVNENIFRVSIGLTFNERWFFKRRVE
ncbi:outer membrane protein transport protein [Bacteroides sp. BFG-638]|uniref:outer membrane protein transport protein n=1 Tax=Bacteroides TaxID=816 RepID=UPI002166B4B7|nr:MULTISPECIES: outer membrane protein transport protein [unclassified Bacteroides]MCS2949251.1 outer membrane protein transport protein [Bacteroides sp. BFG-638]MCS3312844.1 outer membrane protein transport protein [Bacteroides sp. BFG-637]